jgi:tRNA(Ile)-lysidine synthase
VAYSGGLDSTALLQAAQAYAATLDRAPRLAALHVHHGLHEQADAWAAQCARRCEQLGVPLQIHRVQVRVTGEGPEAAARAARYRVFSEAIGPGDFLLLGHHLDDQIETFLLRLLRGAGPPALAGMPARRPLGGGELLRPFLHLPRSALRDYASARGADWLEDPANADARFDRSYLRQQVMPLLAARWPGYRAPVAGALVDLAEQSAALAQLEPAPPACSTLCGDPGLPCAALLAHGQGAAARLLRRWLQLQGCTPPARAPLLSFLSQLHSPPDRAPQLDGPGWSLRRFGPGVFLLPPDQRPGAPAPPERIIEPGAALHVPGVGQVQLCARAAAAPPAVAGAALRLCFRTGGERIRLQPGGPSRAVKQLLQDAGVPPWWRSRIPLLCAGEEVLAVGERWVAAHSRWSLRWRRAPWQAPTDAVPD